MKDLHNKNEKELSKLLTEKVEALRVFRFNISGSKTRNVREGRALRKDIARIYTEESNRSRKSQ
jgi:ribosomal protein L29